VGVGGQRPQRTQTPVATMRSVLRIGAPKHGPHGRVMGLMITIVLGRRRGACTGFYSPTDGTRGSSGTDCVAAPVHYVEPLSRSPLTHTNRSTKHFRHMPRYMSGKEPIYMIPYARRWGQPLVTDSFGYAGEDHFGNENGNRASKRARQGYACAGSVRQSLCHTAFNVSTSPRRALLQFFFDQCTRWLLLFFSREQKVLVLRPTLVVCIVIAVRYLLVEGTVVQLLVIPTNTKH
jgi:hypothetical protein